MTTDRHSEDYCHRCGGPNISWSAPSPLWNQVMRGGSINGPWQWDEIICPLCFAELAAGIADLWEFRARRVHVELETVTPSGRVWSDEVGLWIDPNDLQESLRRLNDAQARIRERREALLAAVAPVVDTTGDSE